MKTSVRRLKSLSAAILSLLCTHIVLAAAPKIEIKFDSNVSDKPFTGRVFITTTQRGDGRPIDSPNWFDPKPFFSLDVRDWKPGETLQFSDDKCNSYPMALAELPAGKYRLQAIMELGRDTHDVTSAPGNGYSEVVAIEHDPASPKLVELKITKKVAWLEFKDTDHTKYIRLRSRLLSEFYKRDMTIQAAVALPDSYDTEKDRRYPTVYLIPGFGGTLKGVGRWLRSDAFEHGEFEPVVVFLDPDCSTGHHVFADSANNGPRGQSLIEELIPHLEKEFRLIPETAARFVTGHSSGGWSSLWLQITYPDTFGGVWSQSPDPVDFNAFQSINIYDPAMNMYTLPDGKLRPLSRADWGPALMTRKFCDMEEVVGHGGQMQSFEAVFSPRGPDERPAKLWDRKTGALDAKIAQAWRKYDIREILEKNWDKLGPKLKGKLHLFCGDKDTFLLEAAFFNLRDTLKKLGSDAYVEVIPGAGHGLPRQVDETCRKQMAEQFEKWKNSDTHRK